MLCSASLPKVKSNFFLPLWTERCSRSVTSHPGGLLETCQWVCGRNSTPLTPSKTVSLHCCYSGLLHDQPTSHHAPGLQHCSRVTLLTWQFQKHKCLSLVLMENKHSKFQSSQKLAVRRTIRCIYLQMCSCFKINMDSIFSLDQSILYSHSQNTYRTLLCRCT